MMITPCKDCPARHPVCHDSCLKNTPSSSASAAQKPLTPERCWTQARSTTTTTRTDTGSGAARSTWERTEERTDE